MSAKFDKFPSLPFQDIKFFHVPVLAQKGMLPANILKMPLLGQRLRSYWHHEITFATVHITDDVSFCDDPGILIHKTAKPCINSMWMALLIHGFVPVNTWLLIAYDTDFYATTLYMLISVSGENQVYTCPGSARWSRGGSINDSIPCFRQRFVYYWSTDTNRWRQTLYMS